MESDSEEEEEEEGGGVLHFLKTVDPDKVVRVLVLGKFVVVVVPLFSFFFPSSFEEVVLEEEGIRGEGSGAIKFPDMLIFAFSKKEKTFSRNSQKSKNRKRKVSPLFKGVPFLYCLLSSLFLSFSLAMGGLEIFFSFSFSFIC